MTQQQNTTFVRLLELAVHIGFNPKWRDPNGDYTRAISGALAPQLEMGNFLKVRDEQGRWALVIGVGQRANVIVRKRKPTDPLEGILFADVPAWFHHDVEHCSSAKGTCLDGVIGEADMQDIGNAIARNLYKTRTDWCDVARVISPWSVV